MANAGRSIWQTLSTRSTAIFNQTIQEMAGASSAVAYGGIAGAGYSLMTRDNLRDKLLGVPVYAGLGAAVGLGFMELRPRAGQIWNDVSQVYQNFASRDFNDMAGNPEAIQRTIEAIRNGSLPAKVKDVVVSNIFEKGLTPQSHLNRIAKPSWQTLQAGIVDNLNSYLRTSIPGLNDYFNLNTATALDQESVPLFLKLALHTAEQETSRIRHPITAASAGVPGGLLEDLNRFNTWEQVRTALRNAPVEALNPELYFETLNRRLPYFHSASSITDLLSVSSLQNLSTPAPLGSVTQRGDIISLLRGQNRVAINPNNPDLAELIGGLDRRISVEGRTLERGGQTVLSQLHFSIQGPAGQVNSLAVPVLGPGDTIIGGLGDRMTNTMRKQIFHKDLMAALAAKKSGVTRTVQEVRGDIWAVQTLGDLVQNAETEEEFSAVTQFIQSALNRASIYDMSEFRPDRNSMSANRFMQHTRGSEVMIQLPDNPLVMNLAGIRVGPDELISSHTALLNDLDLFDVMGESGYGQWGGESSARGLVFQRTGTLLKIDPGALMGSAGKPVIALRDFAKPFNMQFTGRMGENVSWWLNSTAEMQNIMGESRPVVARYHGLFKPEVEFLRQFTARERAIRANQTFTPIHFSEQEFQSFNNFLTRRFGNPRTRARIIHQLELLGQIHEGITAAAIPRDIFMTNQKQFVLSELNPQLFADESLRQRWSSGQLTAGEVQSALDSLVGREFRNSRMDWGYVGQKREIARPTYWGARHAGPTKILGARLEGNHVILSTEESYVAAYGKWGSSFGKHQNVALDQRFINDLVEVVRTMRSSSDLSGLYRHLKLVPLLNSIGLTSQAGHVTGFALNETLGKIQGTNMALLNQLVGNYMPRMQHRAYQSIVQRLSGAGIRIDPLAVRTSRGVSFRPRAVIETERWGPNVLGPDRLARVMQVQARRAHRRVENIVLEMFGNPEQYFSDARGLGAGQYWARQFRANPLGSRQLESWIRLARRFGHSRQTGRLNKVRQAMVGRIMGLLTSNELITQQLAWANLESNNPTSVGITMPELLFFRQTGQTALYDEFMARRGYYGNLQETHGFVDVLHRMAENRRLDNPSQFMTGAPRYGLQETGNIAGRGINERLWRTDTRYETNFIIDLRVADDVMNEANEALREALGISNLELLVPGTKTGFWRAPYLVENTGMISTEGFVNPLENLMRQLRRYKRTYNKELLPGIRQTYETYQKSLYLRYTELISGREGAWRDLGPSHAQMVKFKPYFHRYRGQIGAERASRLIGISPAKFRELAGHPDVTAQDINGLRVLPAISKRHPIGTMDPSLMIEDPDLEGNEMAVDELKRWLKHMDWDHDSVYAHVVTSEGGIQTVLKEVAGGTQSRYGEFSRWSDFLGGATEEHFTSVNRGLLTDEVMETVQNVTKRLEMIHLASRAERASKYFTSNIGRYSNLSRGLSGMVVSIDKQSHQAGQLRHLLARELEQMAIDFGRAAKEQGGSVDPTLLANQIADIMGAAVEGSLPDANKMMFDVFRSLGMVEDQAQRTKQLILAAGTDQTLIADIQSRQTQFEHVVQNFFGDNVYEYFQRGEASRFWEGFRAAQVKNESLNDPDLMGLLIGHYNALMEAGETKAIPSGGKLTSRAQIAARNRFLKLMAQSLKESALDRMRGFFHTPHGQAAATLGITALGAGTILGLVTPATPLSEPGGRTSARLQRTPDAALVGINGQAPLPGGGGGNVGLSAGPLDVMGPTRPTMVPSRRFYYQQSNRVPQIRVQSAGDLQQRAETIARTESLLMDQRNRGGFNINVVSHPGTRRRSDVELEDEMRDGMT